MPRWEPVIGIEVHVQLNSESKIFSTAPVDVTAEPNQCANIVDLAMPGTLPVLNTSVLHKALKFGLAVGAEISDVCRFDRKNYFYPDLPKGYQISQLDEPIVRTGTLDIFHEDGTQYAVRIRRAHLEEDAGKSVHDRFSDATGIDLNRAGTPLLEIVTEPDMRNAAQAAACFRELHKIVTWIGICDGDLSQGSMRCDANVSVRPEGSNELGERTEIKNINSFRFVETAVEHEIERQIEILEGGGLVDRETRQWDLEMQVTHPLRSKELSADYRYFPDPDLLPVNISRATIAEVEADLPELPRVKRDRYIKEIGLPLALAERLTQSKAIADYFDAVIEQGADPTKTVNWIQGSIAARLNRDEKTIDELPFPPKELAILLAHVDERVLSTSLAKEVFDECCNTGKTVDDVIEDKGLQLQSDQGELESLILNVLDANPAQVEQYRSGRTKVIGFFVGKVMQSTQGKADARLVNQLLQKQLNA